MTERKHQLLSDYETAQILGISKSRLYNICTFFDSRSDDQWDLFEGEHFEWFSKNLGIRSFYEEGAVAIAKYLEEESRAGLVSGFFERVMEKLTHRRKKIRQALVKRRVVEEFQSLEGAIVRGDLVFIDRRKTIRLLQTNGKGLNNAARREQESDSLTGREPLEIGVHFDLIEDAQHWSQRGIARIAQSMSENLGLKSRRAWTEAVAEVIEEEVAGQRKYLESTEARMKTAMDEVKAAANKKCQVTLQKQTPAKPFELHVHHLFDKATRSDLAANKNNLLAMHEDLHIGFHRWHGSASCEPKHFAEYITTVELWRFESKRQSEHLHRLINRLDALQREFDRDL